jgi:hypothetical protein
MVPFMVPFMSGGIWPLLIAGSIGLAAGAAGAAWVQDYRIDGMRAERDAALNTIDFASADAARWQQAYEARGKAIDALREQVLRITADAQQAELEAIALSEAAQARADATDRTLAKLRSQADAATEAERPRALSHFARNGLEWLRCRSQAGPGADPSRC